MEFLRDRQIALLALAIPVIAGAIWMASAGAPSSFLIVNLATLVVMSLWVLIGRGPHTALSRHILTAAMLLVLLYPAVLGESIVSVTQDPVARWITIGGVSLHSGMIAAPVLAVIAARNRKYGAIFLLAGIFAVMLQPDAATGFALTFSAIGIHHVLRDWKFALVAILGFLASIQMALAGEIAPQPFVERVLVQAAGDSIFLAIMLALGLLASFLLMLFAVPLSREKRFALGGALFGFVVMSMMSNYPTPLIGHGAAPIIGFGLALGLRRIPQR